MGERSWAAAGEKRATTAQVRQRLGSSCERCGSSEGAEGTVYSRFSDHGEVGGAPERWGEDKHPNIFQVKL